METRNQHDEMYAPKTLYNLLCAIPREMRVQNPNYPNFLEKRDPTFAAFLTTFKLKFCTAHLPFSAEFLGREA